MTPLRGGGGGSADAGSGSSGHSTRRAGPEVLDLPGRMLLPGLIDCPTRLVDE
jgi:imidazolonepropionase-like amidohydrolase